MRAKADAVPDLMTEQKAVETRLKKLEKEFAAVAKKHRSTTAPLYGRLEQVKREIREGENAERDLWRSCIDPDLLAEWNEVSSKLKEAHGRRAKLELGSREKRETAKSDRAEAEIRERDIYGRSFLELADKRDAEAAEMETELEEVYARIAELEKRERDVRERMLVP